MYRACLFCHERFQRNELIRQLPFGRRIAFDVRRERVWVICHACEAWCLVWDDVLSDTLAECDRRFAAARHAIVAGPIAVAFLARGMELIRVDACGDEAALVYRDQADAAADTQLARARATMTNARAVLGLVTMLVVAGSAMRVHSWPLVIAIDVAAQALYVSLMVRATPSSKLPRPLVDGRDATRALWMAALQAQWQSFDEIASIAETL